MPEKDGLEVLMWLRGQQSRPKVIAISGGSTGTPQDLLLTLASFSADKVLPKPVDRKTLRNVVEELLQG